MCGHCITLIQKLATIQSANDSLQTVLDHGKTLVDCKLPESTTLTVKKVIRTGLLDKLDHPEKISLEAQPQFQSFMKSKLAVKQFEAQCMKPKDLNLTKKSIKGPYMPEEFCYTEKQ